MKAKPNISLIVGIAIPILMVIFVAVSIYVPGLFIKPTVNFLYVNGNNDSYSCAWVYETHGGVVTRIEQPNSLKDPGYIRSDCEQELYVYDVEKNESLPITFEEAQRLRLDESPISSDGFELVRGNSGGGDFLFLFDMGRDYNSVYLKGHNVSRKANIRPSGDVEYTYLNYQLLGWIIP